MKNHAPTNEQQVDMDMALSQDERTGRGRSGFIARAARGLIEAHGAFAAAVMADNMTKSLWRAGMTKFSQEWGLVATAIRAATV